MVFGDLADRVWSHWDRPQLESRGVRRKIINTVAQAYEAGMSGRCGTYPWLADICRTGRVK